MNYPTVHNSRACYRAVTTIASVLLLTVLLSTSEFKGKPAHALPEYARQYHVTCSACHTVAPALNGFGKAFLANHFNWPAPRKPDGAQECPIPISGLTTNSSIHDISNGGTTTQFDTQELFASNGFTLARHAEGGYFVDYFLATNQTQAGGLGDAYVTAPVDASRHKELSLTVGQDTPLSYQYEANNSLTVALPSGLSDASDGFAFDTPMPMVRLEYADGLNTVGKPQNYIAIGIPFEGALQANNQSHLYNTNLGYFLHAYRQQDNLTYGGFAWIQGPNSLEGLLATFDLGDHWHVLGSAETGSDDVLGVSQSTSAQVDYVYSQDLALSARLDTLAGAGSPSTTFPVVTVTYYPLKQKIIRLTGETVQQKAARTSSLYLLVQL